MMIVVRIAVTSMVVVTSLENTPFDFRLEKFFLFSQSYSRLSNGFFAPT